MAAATKLPISGKTDGDGVKDRVDRSQAVVIPGIPLKRH